MNEVVGPVNAGRRNQARIPAWQGRDSRMRQYFTNQNAAKLVNARTNAVH
ncbi:Uncharacterized protein ChrSV_1299 [Chromobacterium vaccinii]|nr:Uncharacterized protein ChrSW_1299 [Chromobacterium vaccinii]QND88757.1 Uncharacterized protein ChrSV_1299 [Chromobacterium vaccinii]